MNTNKKPSIEINGMPNELFAIVFDLDDTLIDRELAFFRWTKQAVKNHTKSKFIKDIDSSVEFICNLDNRGFTDRLVLFDQIQAHFGWHPYPGTDDPLNQYYDDILPFIELSVGVSEFLSKLDKHQIPYGIVTNGGQHQIDKAHFANVDRNSKFVLASEFCGSRKPDKKIYEIALAKLEESPENVLFIGDQIKTDIVGAKLVGMPTVLISHNYHFEVNIDSKPDIEVSEMDKLIFQALSY